MMHKCMILYGHLGHALHRIQGSTGRESDVISRGVCPARTGAPSGRCQSLPEGYHGQDSTRTCRAVRTLRSKDSGRGRVGLESWTLVQTGDRVQLHGLTGKPELDGLLGRRGSASSTGRWQLPPDLLPVPINLSKAARAMLIDDCQPEGGFDLGNLHGLPRCSEG
eukprot:3309269-Rhodomonas_salina.1